jgi:hypothetical protein
VDEVTIVAGAIEAMTIAEGAYSMSANDISVFLPEVTTKPSGNPTGGIIMFVDGDDLLIRDSSGVETNLAASGSGDVAAVGDCTQDNCFTAGSPDAALTFDNATSGTVTLQTVTGALGTVTASLPAITGTLMMNVVEDTTPQLGANLDVNSNTLSGYTASRALETDGSGLLQVSLVTTTELAMLDGMTKSGADAEFITGTIATTDRGVKIDANDDLVESQFSPDTGAYATSKTECVMLTAGGIQCSTTGGCTAVPNVEGTNFDYPTADFATGADSDGTWSFPTPPNVTGTTFTAKVYWISNNAACTNEAGTDEVCWTVAGSGIADDAAFHSATLGTSQGIDDVCTANGDAMITTVSDPITHGWAASEVAIVQILRDVDGGHADCNSDQYAQDASLLSVEVCYEVDNVFSGE